MVATTLTVFFSYAFDPTSPAYERSEILSVVERACEIAATSLRRAQQPVRFVVEAELTGYGGSLSTELSRKLGECDLAIVDISDANPNVYFELGYLSAIKRPAIVVRARSAGSDIPADILGTYVLQYDSVESIVGRLAERLREWALERIRIRSSGPELCRAAWGHLDRIDRPIVLVGPRTSSRTDFMDVTSVNYMYLDNFGDKDSLYELGILMSRLFPSVPLVRYISDELPRDAYDHNLIVVGGPGIPGSQGNRLVATLQRRLGIGVDYSSDAKRMVMPDGRELAGEFDEVGRCTLDHGFFARARNPFNPVARVFLLHGIYTMGVLGAARILSDHPAAQDNLRVVVEEVGADVAFWAAFPVQVVTGVPMVPELRTADMVRI
jgi:hypothetical protein